MSAYQTLNDNPVVIIDEDESKQTSENLGISVAENPAITKLTHPNSAERRKSSFGVYNRTVLCVVDSSDSAKDAFDWYLTNVWRFDDLAVLLYCASEPTLAPLSLKTGLSHPADEWRTAIEVKNRKSKMIEDDFEGQCVQRRMRYKMRRESFKNVGEGICRVSEEEHADLIVMGSRSMGGLKRILTGNASEYVVKNCKLPCLVVPTMVYK